MTLPNNIQDRIEKQVSEKFPVHPSKLTDYGLGVKEGMQTALESEALRAQPLVEALEKITQAKRMPGETDDKYVFNRCWHLATEALAEYNKTT